MLNEQYKVSIIVAVYNVEKYISRCLDSLQAQTHKNIEILLVDDGSKDASGIICDKYAANDIRFKVIHKENGGVSKARQTGLDAATGDYIIHADPDDYAEANMIEELLAEAINKQTDIISCDFYLDGKYYKQGYKDEKDFLAKIINIGIISACWNVLVRRSFVVEHNIRFTPDWLNQSEDFLFMARLLTAGATANHLNKAFYYYKSYNSNSLSNKKSKKRIDSINTVIIELGKLVDTKNYNLLYVRKKIALKVMFENRYFDGLKLYPEIHELLISDTSEGTNYLAIAIKGKPQFAYLHYWLNTQLFKLRKIFRKIFPKLC